jgi:hypothetical protein
MKKVQLSLLTAALLATGANADSIADAFKNGKVSGEIRAGYVNQNNEGTTADNQNYAIGGQLGFETAAVNGISAGAVFYTTQRLGDKGTDDLGTSLFDSNNNSYSILGQAYIQANMGNTTLKAGRQQIDTPFADSDDIRMIPNLFEAYVLSNTDIADTTLIAAKVNKWSGVDTDAAEKWHRVGGEDGTVMLAAIYGGIENVELSAWYYDVDAVAKITYLEASTEIAGIALAAQYANFSEDKNSNTDGSIWGLSAEYGIADTGLTLMAAYNKESNDDGHSIINGFGGGPYFTSMDEGTMEMDNEDGKGVMFGATYEPMENLAFTVAHAQFEDSEASQTEVEETDVVVEYAFNDSLSAALIYTDYETSTGGVVAQDDTTFKRTQLYVNYTF